MKIQNLKSFDPRVLVEPARSFRTPRTTTANANPSALSRLIDRRVDISSYASNRQFQGRVERLMTRISVRQRARVDVRQRSSSPLARDSSPGKPTTVKSDIGFLPFRSMSADEARLARPPRIETNMTDRHPCPVYYVPASPLFSPIPPLKNLADGARDPHNAFDAMLKRIRDFGSSLAPPKLFGTSCNTHKHSQSELALWERRGYSEFMFGFATTPTRALDFIPRWSEWLPSSVPPAGDDPADKWRATNAKSQPLRRLTASAVVLIPPKEELDQAWEVESAARGAGLDITLKELTADRFERRYMSLVQEMWKEAQTRERLGAPIVQWFTLADDDTYFLSLDSVARMLSKYNPVEAHFIGGRLCVTVWKRVWWRWNDHQVCCNGNARDVQQVVTRETTLHQLDIRDEGHGIFQAGWRFTSIHHWRSWFQLQPRAHPHTLKNPATLASLLGSAARAVGPENWTRRYVWGLPPPDTNGGVSKTPSVVLSLGYSITVHGAGILKSPDLDQVEMTFALSKLTSSTRPAFLETKQRRTYYLYDLHTGYSNADQTDLNLQPDVAIMSHINQEGEVIDLVWDGRTRTSKSLTDTAYDDIGLGKN
ncbi:hypothetical protein PSTT_10046 [Puccinia striiformis]|uniref:Uncharacterized protein n=1 Tax=Puccinia striiformis TaxID=27350 RepID=A0A2S4V612_9BASI|nr:hypothetical protein PSTT_10046 [Puccinia striiformis]